MALIDQQRSVVHWRTDLDLKRHDAHNVTRCGRRVCEVGGDPRDYQRRDGEPMPVRVTETTPSILDLRSPVTCVPCLESLRAEFPANVRVARLLREARRACPAD